MSASCCPILIEGHDDSSLLASTTRNWNKFIFRVSEEGQEEEGGGMISGGFTNVCMITLIPESDSSAFFWSVLPFLIGGAIKSSRVCVDG